MPRSAEMRVTEAKNGPVFVLVPRTIAIYLGVIGAIRQGIGDQTRIWTQLHHAKGYDGSWKSVAHAFRPQKDVDIL